MLNTYMVPQGMVWDEVAFKIYGDEALMDLLLKANPQYRHIVKFEEPKTIAVPPRPEKRSSAELPPWKQE